MATPTATRTVADVMTYTKRQFGDESGAQLVDSDIIRWINQAQMEIVNKTPIIQATATQTTVPGTQKYPIPADLIQLESVSFGNNYLQQTDFDTIRAQSNANGTYQADCPQYWYVWANQIYLWPVPSTAKTLEVNYSKAPTAVTTGSDLISLPDRYFDRICEYVMSKAYELDEDWQGHTVNKQAFEDKLMEGNNSDKNLIGAFPVARDWDYE